MGRREELRMEPQLEEACKETDLLFGRRASRKKWDNSGNTRRPVWRIRTTLLPGARPVLPGLTTRWALGLGKRVLPPSGAFNQLQLFLFQTKLRCAVCQMFSP